MSALVATGVPFATLEDANRAEVRMVTVPLTVGAGVLGALAYGLATSATSALGGLFLVAVGWAGVLLAARLVTRVARPWLRAAVSTDNLRTG
jgi:predicted membrane channel-forming protein YqfA (hemolysin III family)